MNITDSYLTITEVIARAGICRARVYVLMSQGRFPRSVLLSGPTEKRKVRWRTSDIESWLRERATTQEASQ